VFTILLNDGTGLDPMKPDVLPDPGDGESDPAGLILIYVDDCVRRSPDIKPKVFYVARNTAQLLICLSVH
jgi:hypothetical protein